MTVLQPDVTFVIAAYNAERFLRRSVESALAQTGLTVEVIVVDDKSSDQTLAVAQSLASETVRVIALAKNRGPGGARNAGFAAARGRWIAVLDADDTVMPGRLARMIALAEDRGAVAVVDNLTTVSNEGGGTGSMFRRDYLAGLGRIDLPTYIEGNGVFGSTFNLGYMKPVFERRFVESHRLRYRETLRIGEDYLFMASVLASGGRCAIDPEVGYVYHVREGSISRVLERRHVEALQEADAAFERSFMLEDHAREALRRRRQNLRRAGSFLALVEHLKNRNVLGALGIALHDPAALRHLRMPVAKRIRRAASAFSFRTGRTSPELAAQEANGESV